MEFTIYLETTEDYEPSDVIDVIQKAIRMGLTVMPGAPGNNNQQVTTISLELLKNSIIIERTDN